MNRFTNRFTTRFTKRTIATIQVAVALTAAAALFAPIAAQAEVDGQQACMQDAFTFCGQFIPDRDRVGACLFANKTRISPLCREAMKRYTPRTASAR
jgi:hypothetical protein